MTDKELLELAAKAAGIDGLHLGSEGLYWWLNGNTWNPLTDDGDALRLAVKLKIDLEFGMETVVASAYANDTIYTGAIPEQYNNDPYAATRRAIVRAAAEIGKKMK